MLTEPNRTAAILLSVVHFRVVRFGSVLFSLAWVVRVAAMGGPLERGAGGSGGALRLWLRAVPVHAMELEF